MPQVLGQVLVGLILIGVVTLAVRSVWKSHKAGGHCSGNCSRCGGGCHHGK